MPPTLYEQAGNAQPLSQVVLLAVLALALYHVHWSMVLAPFAFWFLLWWVVVIPIILLPIFGADTFFATENPFYLVKLYSLVFPILIAGVFKLQDVQECVPVMRTRIPTSVARALMSAALVLNILETVVWELAMIGQTWFNWVNAVSGMLLCLAVVYQAVVWGIAVRVRRLDIIASGPATETTTKRTEVHVHILLSLPFVIAYSMWNAAYVSVFSPENWVFHGTVALVMPFIAAATHTEISWIDIRAHALLGSIILIKFPGAGLTEALRMPKWVSADEVHAVFSIFGLLATLFCVFQLAVSSRPCARYMGREPNKTLVARPWR